MSLKRVLIFDSGVGGLSVFGEIIKLNPNIQCHYLFDNAYFPYGELPRSQLVKRLRQLLAHFMHQYPTDLVVIACNSASTVALESLRAFFNMPIVGVVPAIKPATLLTANNIIGLLATPATIERVYTTKLIQEFASDKIVLRIGSTELVKIAEDKLIGKAIIQSDLKAVLAPWLHNAENNPDTLVLGCTHFPLIKDEIQACFSRPMHLVDSGQAIALRVKQLLVDETASNACIDRSPSTHQAFYTQHFSDEIDFIALKNSFRDYGFNRVDYYHL